MSSQFPSVLRPRTWLVALVSVCVCFTVPIAAPAHAAPTGDSARAAAGWLARQMVDGNHLETVFDGVSYPDAGLTIDAVLAFAAAGVAGGHSDAAMVWLASEGVLPGYIGDGETSAYAGSTAKAAYAALVAGYDPYSFGGVNLVQRLLGLMSEGEEEGEEANKGRFIDQSPYGDFSNAIGQSFALLALVRTPDGPPADAVTYLQSVQCPNGGFPLTLPDPTSPQPCVSHVDATAFVIQALLAVGENQDAAEALAWLLSVQSPNGGFAGDSPTVNANTTGLAAQALAAGGHFYNAELAAAFVKSLQVGCEGPEAQQGAIAYDDEDGFADGTAPRATAQAILGMVRVPLGSLTAVGASDDAPALDCAAPPLPDPNPPNPPSDPEPPANDDDDADDNGTSGSGGSDDDVLPVTGGTTSTWVLLGLGITALGVVAIGVTHRRGGIRTGARKAALPRKWAPIVGASLLIASLGGVAAAPPPAQAAACDGVTVIVDFRSLGGAVTRCAPGDPTSGISALSGAGFGYSYVPGQMGMICQINSAPNPCNGAPADAYWSYWHAQPGGSWQYSSAGAGSYDPAPGSVEGWSFGSGQAPGVSPPAAPLPPPPATPDPQPQPQPTAPAPAPQPAPQPAPSSHSAPQASSSAASRNAGSPSGSEPEDASGTSSAPESTQDGHAVAAETTANSDATAAESTTLSLQNGQQANSQQSPAGAAPWIAGILAIAVFAGLTGVQVLRRRAARTTV